MSNACEYLHDNLRRLPRDLSRIPLNGVYVVFEKGEKGHGGERIVRAGTHTAPDNLARRIHDHLHTPNRTPNRSVFRRHVGRCLLARVNDPFLAQWEYDRTTKKSREKYAGMVDERKMQEVEENVTRYIIANFSFAFLHFSNADKRKYVEEGILSTIYQCPDCGPSDIWLGRFHPRHTMRSCGLWNVQGLDGPVLTLDEAMQIISAGKVA